MSVEELVVQTLHQLPPDKQREVLDFVEFLASRIRPKHPLPSVKGMLADLKIDVSADDIDDARREMWGNFPRGDLP
jgi:hypothetical protein